MTKRNIQDFFLANRSIGAKQNALALAGDYLSAAAFLGSIAMYFNQGMDSLFYAVATLFGWPLLLLLFADKLRESNAYTLTGVLNQHFTSIRLKLLSGSTSVLISIFYLLVQLMGASVLLNTLLGIGYVASLATVCSLTFLLVLMGGMRATTLVQSVKAVILFGFAFIMLFLVWRYFEFSLPNLWEQARELSGITVFMPSFRISSGLEQLSLVLGLMLGLLGLPHVLMRFFTVKNKQTAIQSATLASFLIAIFFTLNLIIGFGAYVILFGETLTGGGNMALLHLATELGGEYFKWLFSIVVFITILAVIAGLVMAASANLSQDLIPLLFPQEKNNMQIAQLSIVVLFVISATLAYLFKDFNLAFLFGIAFSWAASAHFPVLFCQFFLKGFNERAAFYSLLIGALGSTLFIITSDTIWVNLLGFEMALHPYRSPTLFVLPFSFGVAYLLRDRH